jgi:PIN domain nuclease of toxin-antitoxin system
MKYLLDTHSFLWFINNDTSLSQKAKMLIENPQSFIYLSVASVWEMAIKISLNRLEMPSPFASFIDRQLQENDITLLEIKTAHVAVVATLPFHHRDPFDRLLIAQAQNEKIPILGQDKNFDAYDVQRIW